MEHSSALPAAGTDSERDFSLFLRLVARPPSPLHTGHEPWGEMYQLARESQDLRGAAYALQNVFASLTSAGRTIEALVCARRLLAIGQEADDPLIVSHALADVAWANWVMGDHVAASSAAHEALALARRLQHKPPLHPFTGPEAIRRTVTDLLLTLKQSRGALRRAVADQEAMLQLHRERGDVLSAISAMEGLGNVYKELGEYAEAHRWLSAALQDVEVAEAPDPRILLLTRAGLLGNLGVVLTAMGSPGEAIRRVQESIAIYSHLDDSLGQIPASGQLGRALLQAGHVDEALSSFHKMLQLARRNDALAWEQAAHFNLAGAYLSAGYRAEAAWHSVRAAALARENLGYLGVDFCWLRAALFHPLLPPLPGMSPFGHTARFIALAYYAFDAVRREVRNSKPAAVVERWIDEFEIVIQTVLMLPPAETLSIPPGQPQGGSLCFAQETMDALDCLACDSRFIGWHPLDIGLYCLEAFRAQEFQERLLLDKVELELSHDLRQVSELAKVEAELEKVQRLPPIVITGTASYNARGEFVADDSSPPDSIPEQEAVQQEHFRRVAELSSARDALARQTIESSDAPMAPMPDPPRVSDIRAVLGEDEIFIEFVLLGQSPGARRSAVDIMRIPFDPQPNGAFAVAITRSWADVVPLGPTAAIESQCRKLLDMLDRFGSELSVPFFQSEAGAAFDMLLRPVWDRAGSAMNGVRHLVVATDGILNMFPIDLLVEEIRDVRAWRQLRYVASRFSTECAPSAAVFVNSRVRRNQRTVPGQTFVGFGDPTYSSAGHREALRELPGTRREIETIATLFRERKATSRAEPVRLFLGANARKDHLSNPELLQNAEFIHVACHGTAGEAPYRDGALFLSNAEIPGVVDGVLTTREVMGLHTGAKLVVMSACQSALGEMTRGEGVQGLVRAWLLAGAQSVVATLWEVEDDATASLMATMYRISLNRSMSMIDALAAAKRQAIEDERTACPFFWAAFVAFGDRFLDQTPRLARQSEALRDASPEHRAPRNLQMTVLTPDARNVLEQCALAWEAATRSHAPAKYEAFFHASGELAVQVDQRVVSRHDDALGVALGLVPRNCRVAWEHWASQGRASLAVRAYRAYTEREPSARSEEWEALNSAYQKENLWIIRDQAQCNLLRREYELVVDSSHRVSLVTTVTWDKLNARATGSDGEPTIEIALRIDDPGFTSTASHCTYVPDIGWAVFPMRWGGSFRVTEMIPAYLHVLDKDHFLVSGTWGSSLFPHKVLVRADPEFIPFRLGRQQISKNSPLVTLRFTPEGSVITMHPVWEPWLERIGILYRRAPGANALFAAPGSPLLEEMEFERFESLFAEAGQAPVG